jgi:hypothetical protein
MLGLVALAITAVSAGAASDSGLATQEAISGHSDFDGDGFDDLAIASPTERVSGKVEAGRVHILYGTSSGLTGTSSQTFSQATPGMSGSPETRDSLGHSLAAGDFDANGYTDLAIGVPREDLNGKTDAGLVQLLYGSSTGLTPRGHFSYAGATGRGQCTCRFGESLAVGDFDNDGVADLAVGAPATPRRTVNVGTSSLGYESGEVVVLYGNRAGGLGSAGSTRLTTPSSFFAYAAQKYGTPGMFLEFGAAVAAGDHDRDGFDDVAVGIPGAGALPPIKPSVGAVAMFRGSSTGVKTGPWSPGGSNPDGLGDTGGRFGEVLAFGDFDGNGYEELAVGVPRDTCRGRERAGAVLIFDAVVGLANDFWQQDNIEGETCRTGEQFGYALVAADFTRDGRDDLAIAAPFETVGVSIAAGIVYVLKGSSTGLSRSGARTFHQNKAGVSGSAEVADTFGRALAAGDYSGDGRRDLAIGVPGEGVGDIPRAGLVHVFVSSSSGVSATGSQAWTQNSSGVPDQAWYEDGFGGALR